jgi:hypothetical protein
VLAAALIRKVIATISLILVAANIYEMSVTFYQTTLCKIPENSHLVLPLLVYFCASVTCIVVKRIILE